MSETTPQGLFNRAIQIEDQLKRVSSKIGWQVVEGLKQPGEVYVGNCTWWPDEPDGEQNALNQLKKSYPGLQIRLCEPAGVDTDGYSIARLDPQTELTQKAAGIFISLPPVNLS